MSDQTTPKGDFWDQMDEVEKEYRGGGGGFFCQFGIKFGFKIFNLPAREPDQPAIPLEDTFFWVKDPLDKPAREAVLDQAKKAVVDLGAKGNPSYGVLLTIHVDTIYGRDSKWTSDNSNFIASYGEGSDYNEILKPALKQFNLTGGDYWGHIVYVESKRIPKNPRLNPDGTPKKNLVPYPDAVYPDRATMVKASGLAPADDDHTPSMEVPPGWDAPDWQSVIDEIKASLTTKIQAEGKKPLAACVAIAGEYGVDKKYIASVATQLGLM